MHMKLHMETIALYTVPIFENTYIKIWGKLYMSKSLQNLVGEVFVFKKASNLG